MAGWQMPKGVYSMTPDQRDCLRIVCEWFDTYGRTPTYREIAREMDSEAPGCAHTLVSGLVERGWLARTPRKAGALRILHRPPMPDFSTPGLPIAGRA